MRIARLEKKQPAIQANLDGVERAFVGESLCHLPPPS